MTRYSASLEIPPELEAICMKAVALNREDRFRGAMELHDEIQLFLEGVKEREREYAAAEERGDEKEMLLHWQVVEQYNDGQLDALLKGDGTLTVRTRAFPCRCLLDGRTVKPEELAHLGHHPFSGRALDAHVGAEGMSELEPKEPVWLKVHAAGCEPCPLEGADVWLWKYEEIGPRLILTTPREQESCSPFPVPRSPWGSGESVCRACGDESGGRFDRRAPSGDVPRLLRILERPRPDAAGRGAEARSARIAGERAPLAGAAVRGPDSGLARLVAGEVARESPPAAEQPWRLG